MRNQTELKARLNAVAESLEQGNSSAEIISTYTAQWDAGERTIERYIALAKDMVAGRLQKRDAVIEAVRCEAVAEAAEKWLKSNLELEAKLCEIVDGKLEAEKLIYTGNGVLHEKCKPSHRDIIYAIDKLWKMRGCYFAAKGNETGNPGNKTVTFNIPTEKQKDLLEKV
ncbi:MAG: hypothetical protein ACLQQ4_15250 [Bacteroidia bacterium]